MFFFYFLVLSVKIREEKDEKESEKEIGLTGTDQARECLILPDYRSIYILMYDTLQRIYSNKKLDILW